MIKKYSTGEVYFQAFNYFLLTLLSFVTIYPFWNQLASSFSGSSPLRLNKVFFVPLEPQWDSYRYLLDSGLFWLGFRLTAAITVIGVVVSVFLTALFAYPLSKKDFKWRNGLTVFVVITMFFSGGLIPEYLVYKQLNLLDNFLVYIIPGAISTWSLLILRNFFQEIPESLEESALMDGASEFAILMKIIIPMSMPAIATITLWAAVGKWNTFSQCIYFTSSTELRTLQVVLRSVVMGDNMGEGYAYISPVYSKMSKQSIASSAIILTTLPMLLLYPFLQKYFVKGIIMGSLKG